MRNRQKNADADYIIRYELHQLVQIGAKAGEQKGIGGTGTPTGGGTAETVWLPPLVQFGSHCKEKAKKWCTKKEHIIILKGQRKI